MIAKGRNRSRFLLQVHHKFILLIFFLLLNGCETQQEKFQNYLKTSVQTRMAACGSGIETQNEHSIGFLYKTYREYTSQAKKGVLMANIRETLETSLFKNIPPGDRLTAFQIYVNCLDKESNKQKYLVAEYNNKQITESEIILDLNSYAVKLDGDWRPAIGLTAELFFPKDSATRPPWDLVPTLSIGFTSWSRDSSYTTLTGLQPTHFSQDNNFYYADVGARKYLQFGNATNIYFGASIGFTFETEEKNYANLYPTLLFGTEYYPGDFKVAFDLGYSNFRLNEKNISFNSFGNASIINDTTNISGIKLGISIGKSF